MSAKDSGVTNIELLRSSRSKIDSFPGEPGQLASGTNHDPRVIPVITYCQRDVRRKIGSDRSIENVGSERQTSGRLHTSDGEL